MLKHIPTGYVFQTRKDLKIIMGEKRYQRALQNGDIAFLNEEQK